MANLNVLEQVQGQVADVVSPMQVGNDRHDQLSFARAVQADAEALQRVESARTQGAGLIENAATARQLGKRWWSRRRSGQQKSGYRSEAWHSFWYVHLPREGRKAAARQTVPRLPQGVMFLP